MEVEITVKDKWNNQFHLTFKSLISLSYLFKINQLIKIKISFRNWDSFAKSQLIKLSLKEVIGIIVKKSRVRKKNCKRKSRKDGMILDN